MEDGPFMLYLGILLVDRVAGDIFTECLGGSPTAAFEVSVAFGCGDAQLVCLPVVADLGQSASFVFEPRFTFFQR